MEDVSGLVQILVAVGASGVIGAIVNGFLNRKKLGADATKIITDAAASVTDTMQKRLNNLEIREDQRDAEEINWRLTLAEHAAWDRRIVAQIRLLHPEIQVEDPPSLFPPYLKKEKDHGQEGN